MIKNWFVYIVSGVRGQFYIGCTTNVERRIYEHNHTSKGAKWCKANRPVKLEWVSKSLPGRSEAQKLESWLKTFTKLQKEYFIKNGFPKSIHAEWILEKC
jgi:putative endonuclease